MCYSSISGGKAPWAVHVVPLNSKTAPYYDNDASVVNLQNFVGGDKKVEHSSSYNSFQYTKSRNAGLCNLTRLPKAPLSLENPVYDPHNVLYLFKQS